MSELDLRIVRFGIEIGDSIKWYSDLNISASGIKFTNENQSECEIKIANLDRETRNYVLTEGSPFNKNRDKKKVFIEAGRVSSGAKLIYSGDITSATVSPPPDITITIKSKQADSQKGNIISTSAPAVAPLSQITEQVGKDLGMKVVFEATDKNISNYSFTGGALKQVGKLGEAGGVNAYVDNGTLVVKDAGAPLAGRMRILDADSGMIGIPEITEKGIKVKYLIDSDTVPGGALQITSKLNLAINGTYTIYKLSFDISSRDTPFYWIAEATRS